MLSHKRDYLFLVWYTAKIHSLAPNLVAMRFMLYLLATFLQSLFNFWNVQQLLGLYGLSIRRRRILTAVLRYRQIRRRNRRRRYWCLPRPRQSWFEMHYYDDRLPDDYFRSLLRVRKETFRQLLNVVSPHITRRDTYMRNCITPEKVLAIGL